MIFSCGNLHAEVGADAAEEAWLDDYLSADSPGAEFSEAFQAGRWDGKIRIYDRRRRRFPTGLVRLVAAAAKAEGREARIDDARERPREEFELRDGGWLRDYQREAVELLARRTRGIWQLPTGSGKTEIFVAWGLGYRFPWLVLSDTRDLMRQAADRFELRSGREKAGRIGDGIWEPRRFTSATLQTIHARLKEKDPRVLALLEEVRGLVVDEVHILPADTFYDVAMNCPNAYYRAGTSATPLQRGDARDFYAVGATGGLAFVKDRAELVAAGHVARDEIVFVEHAHPRRTGSFQALYDELVVMSPERNALVRALADAMPAPGLVFVRSIAHGQALAREIPGAEFVWGETSGGARRGACERLERRDTRVLVTSKIFNKGIDLPFVRGAVNAAGGKSEIDALQRLGRLSRPSAGKTSFTYYDVMDVGNRALERHARGRADAYREAGYGVRVAAATELGLRARP